MKHIYCFIALWCITMFLGFSILYNGSELESLVGISDVGSNDSGISAYSAVACDDDSNNILDIESEFISRFEAAELFQEQYNVSVVFDSDDYLLVCDFLNLLAEYDRYIVNSPSGPVYLLGDSNFLLNSEFYDLFSDLDRRVTREEFDNLINKINTCNKFLDMNARISDPRQYEDLLYGYYREFWSLYNANPNGCKYWLHDMLSNNLGNARLSSVLHESAHEESARLSYGYSHRSCKNHDWQVVWYDNIRKMHPYNVARQSFCEIDIKNLPKTRDVLDFSDISQSVKDTIWFQTYVDRYDVISNLFSIYGMTEEFCANMIDVKFAMISDMIGYNNKHLSDDDLRPYYFWMSLICEYILALKESDYQSYEIVIFDESLIGLLRDVREHIEFYANSIGVAYSNTWDSVALKSWYDSPRIQMALCEYL